MKFFDGRNEGCPKCNINEIQSPPAECKLVDENNEAYHHYCSKCHFVWDAWDGCWDIQDLLDSSIRELVVDWGQPWQPHNSLDS